MPTILFWSLWLVTQLQEIQQSLVPEMSSIDLDAEWEMGHNHEDAAPHPCPPSVF